MTGHLTLGVIGHVDHGKTALVRELTGIETDRLKEEQERGLSIVLGFSYIESSNGILDLIDVPGHENFIRTMISGATGIDGVLLVVAANEGVMPQTREHFDIAQLLGLDRGLVVLTKVDLVTAEELTLVEEEVCAFTMGSFLERAPVVRTSTLQRKGLEELRTALDGMDERESTGSTSTGFFLPIDRVFAMQGFGAVVTGTLRSGVLNSGENVEILPRKEIATVRGLQNHNQAVETVFPGQRVAVNLRNIKWEELRRGDVLASPGFLKITRRIDVELKLLKHIRGNLKNGTAVRVLFGTTEVIAKIRLLDCAELNPGSTGLGQLRFQRDVTTHRSERFIIRNISPVFTFGGGRILDTNPPRHRRFDDSVTNRLRNTADGNAIEVVRLSLNEGGMCGENIESLRERLGISSKDMEAVIGAASVVKVGEDRIISQSSYAELMDGISAVTEHFHDENPHRQGLKVTNIPSQLQVNINEEVLHQAIGELKVKGELWSNGSIVRKIDFDPLIRLPKVERRLAGELEETFRLGGLTPPSLDAVLGGDDTKQDIYQLLREMGKLVRLRTYDRDSNFVLHQDVLSDIKQKLQKAFPYPREFSISDLRDLLGTTRKYLIPLVEHLDATGVTIRIGNIRRLRDR